MAILNKKVKVGIIGSGFISDIHVRSIKTIPDAEIVACSSIEEESLEKFTEKYSIPNSFADYTKMLELDEIDLVVLGVPNDLHAQMAVDCANAGKNVICEKPICNNLKDADLMIESCKKAKVKLMYIEQYCFAPKYIKLKEIIQSGSLGDIYYIKHSQKHDGPHSEWFYNIDRTGGGVVMDMGCHTFGFFRWLTNNAKIENVYSDLGIYMHKNTLAEDNAITIIKFDGGITALSEVSWAKKGGYDDRAEVYGTKGVCYVDMSSSLKTFSEVGFNYVAEKTPKSAGWSYPVFEEDWQSGFPQLFSHYINCIKNNEEPLFNGEDGRAILEMVYATYESAREGKKVKLPFKSDVSKPIDLWLEK